MQKKADPPVTKSEFKAAMKKVDKRFEMQTKTLREEWREDIHDMTENLLERMGEMFTDLKDRIILSEDRLMKRMDSMDADNAAGTIQIRRLTKRTDDHEKRITRLESKN